MNRFRKNKEEQDAQPAQRTRFETNPNNMSSIWASIRKHLTAPTHPSTTSESAHGSGIYADTDLFQYNDAHGMRSPSGNHLPLELIDPVAASRRKKGSRNFLKSGHKTSNQDFGLSPGDSWKRGRASGQPSGSRNGEDDEEPTEPFSTVVVDNDFEQVVPLAARSDSGSTARTPGASASHVPTTKEGSSLFGKSTEKGDGQHEMGDQEGSGEQGGEGSTKGDKRMKGWKHWIETTWLYEFFIGAAWPSIVYFFNSKYTDSQKERAFIKETWFQSKLGAMASALFFLISWALSTGLQPKMTPFVLVAYLGFGGLFTIPLIGLIMFNYPRRYNWIWQPVLAGASWVLADVVIIEAYRCQFFSTNNTCGTKNFLNMLGFAFGQPVLALLAMRQSRLFAAIGAGQWLVLAGVLLMTQNNSPTLFYRNMVNFALFHAFLIGTSFLRERGDRHMFEMRQQLKLQYRATQSAQVMERKASDSKRRFVSYIFHEVRVPLNTALLAVQNLEGENVFKHIQADQNEMVHGLVRSLTTMEKVLNDVLSFNRMEAGKFAQARKPFDFHKSINLVAMSHRPQAQAAGIEFHVELDDAIDKLGGMFVGDEMRLRQITSNLVSNSIKFTEEGSVRIVTKLIYPRMDTESIEEEVEDHLKEAAENQQKQQNTHLSHGSFASDGSKRFSSDSMNMPGMRSGMGMDVEKGSIHLESLRHASDPKMLESVPMVQPKVDKSRQKAIVRIEIHDTGVGLKKNDLDDSRLFSPYVQTEIGRRQGGKGSGLGLALVRQIVRLSNGRLGVDSEYGKGSVFWFELPYAIPPPSRKKTPISIMGGASPHPSRPPLMTSAMAVPTIDEESMTSPAVERDDPLDRIEHRGSDAMPLEPRPQGLPGSGQVGGQGQERPKLQETESSMPLLNRTPSGRIRRESVPTETVIVTTYPPPDSNSSSDSSFEGLAAEVIASTPQVEFEQRRESDWSTSVAESSRKGSEQPLLPGPGSGSNAGRQERLPSVDDEPPLCAFVVDDDRLTRMLMSRMLTRLGHQVTNAENGKIALQMIKDSQEGKPGVPKFDVCFLDNQMPFMSGVEVVRALREMGNPLYVVGCTGNALREDQDEYLSAGADGIIPKPVHQKSVLEQIKEARKRIAGKTKPKAIQPSY